MFKVQKVHDFTLGVGDLGEKTETTGLGTIELGSRQRRKHHSTGFSEGVSFQAESGRPYPALWYIRRVNLLRIVH